MLHIKILSYFLSLYFCFLFCLVLFPLSIKDDSKIYTFRSNIDNLHYFFTLTTPSLKMHTKYFIPVLQNNNSIGYMKYYFLPYCNIFSDDQIFIQTSQRKIYIHLSSSEKMVFQRNKKQLILYLIMCRL